MAEITFGVSWLAVAVGAIVAFILGWLWYSPKMFGEKWAEGVGVKLGAADDMPAPAMITQAVGVILLSWFVAVTASKELLLTLLLGTIAFAVMAKASAMFRGQSQYARMVDVGYLVAAVIVMIIVNAIF